MEETEQRPTESRAQGAIVPGAAWLFCAGVALGLLWIVLDLLRWTGMQQPVVAAGGAGAAIVLVFAGASWSALRSGRAVMRALSATAMLAAVGMWALFLLALAFKSWWGFDHPVGDWAVSPEGDRAAVAILSRDSSGDPRWDVAVIAPGALSRVTFRYEGVKGGDEPPVLQLPGGDDLIIDDSMYPLHCRTQDEVGALTEQLEGIAPGNLKRFGTWSSDCGNKVSATFTSPSAKQACQAIRERAGHSGWSVRQPQRVCSRLVTPEGVPFDVWRLNRRTVILDEQYPRVDQGFTSYG